MKVSACWKTTFLLLFVATSQLPIALGADDAAYKSPDLKTPIFGGELTFDKVERKTAATALAGITRNGLDLAGTDGLRDATRLLGLALRLDPANRAAIVTNGYLADQQRPAQQADWKTDDAVTQLRHAASAAKAANTKADSAAAAYLFASLLLLRADDDDRFELESLKQGGVEVTWDWADNGTAAKRTVKSTGRHGIFQKSAERAAIQATLRDQCTIKGLVVSDIAGEMHGKVMEIIAVAPKGDENPFPGIKTEGSQVGQEMRTSLEEAVRLAKLRNADAASINLEISFDDKYSSKDGGSAGAAFTLLILSSMNQFELDPAAAITGDITVDGKIRPIGGLSAKIHGASLDHISVVAIPATNLEQLREAALIGGPGILWESQVVGVDTLDDAIAVMRKDRTPQMQDAFKAFEELRAKMASRPIAALATDPEAKSSINKILLLMPNHLSTVMLQQLAEGKGLHKLSLTGSLQQIGTAISGVLQSTQRRATPIDLSAVQLTREKIRKIRPMLDPAVNDVLAAIENYCESIEREIAASQDRLNFQRKTEARKICAEKATAVRDAFHKLVADDGVVDKLLRGE